MQEIVANVLCERQWAQSRLPRHHHLKELPTVLRSRLTAAVGLLPLLSTETSVTICSPFSGRPVIETSFPVNIHWRADCHASHQSPDVLCWGQTQPASHPRSFHSPPRHWLDVLWKIRGTPQAAMFVNNKHYLPKGFPGTLIDSEAQLTNVISSLPDTVHVAKLPFGASGNGQTVFTPSDPERIAHLKRLMKLHGALLIQRWVPRSEDFGVCGLLDDEQYALFTPHELFNTEKGRFQGIQTTPPTFVAKQQAVSEINDKVLGVISFLHQANYRGPFSIDGFLYHPNEEESAVPVVSEVNGRISFGLVAHAAALHFGTAVKLAMGTLPPETPALFQSVYAGNYAWISPCEGEALPPTWEAIPPPSLSEPDL